MSSEAQTSYHGIAARLDRIPITGMHRKVLWLLAGITFCDSVDMAVGGPIGAVLQSTYDASAARRRFSSAVLSSPYSASSLQALLTQRS